LPVVTKKLPPQIRELVALLVRDRTGQQILLIRSSAGLFAGLWNLPMREGRGRGAALALLAELGVRARLDAQPCAAIEHVLTHRRLQIQLFIGQLAQLEQLEQRDDNLQLRLQPRAQLGELGVSRLTHKALEQAPNAAEPSAMSALSKSKPKRRNSHKPAPARE
jgi:A/G-specific adenine glycosylase